MDLQPIEDWIIVREFGCPQTTEGGIALPDTGGSSRRVGEVLATGSGKTLGMHPVTGDVVVAPMTVKVGDIVVFHGGQPVHWWGKWLLMMHQDHPFAIATGEVSAGESKTAVSWFE